MHFISINELIFDHASVVKFPSNFHDFSFLISKELWVTILPSFSSAALTVFVVDIPLVFNIDISTVPGDFAHNILNEEAVGVSTQPVLLNAREVPRIIYHWIQELKLICL